jgi:hypothetical protein
MHKLIKSPAESAKILPNLEWEMGAACPLYIGIYRPKKISPVLIYMQTKDSHSRLVAKSFDTLPQQETFSSVRRPFQGRLPIR